MHFCFRRDARAMGARALIEALDGAVLEKPSPDTWSGSFEGRITIQDFEDRGERVKFDVILPTSEQDINDYIWRSEREENTTDKDVLAQGGSQVEGARVVGIEREGKSEAWTPAASERYRLTLKHASLPSDRANVSRWHLRWFNEPRREWVDVAVARSS
jgi:hypothetical protein